VQQQFIHTRCEAQQFNIVRRRVPIKQKVREHGTTEAAIVPEWCALSQRLIDDSISTSGGVGCSVSYKRMIDILNTNLSSLESLLYHCCLVTDVENLTTCRRATYYFHPSYLSAIVVMIVCGAFAAF